MPSGSFVEVNVGDAGRQVIGDGAPVGAEKIYYFGGNADGSPGGDGTPSRHLTPEMIGIVARFLDGTTGDVSRLASALRGASRDVGYYAAALAEVHRSCPVFSEVVLKDAYDRLPGKNSSCDFEGGYDDSPDRREELYREAGAEVRAWIQENPGRWAERVEVSSLSHAASLSPFAAKSSDGSGGGRRRLRALTVSQGVAESISLRGLLGPDECRYRVDGRWCRQKEACAAIENEYESCLLAVNGTPVHVLDNFEVYRHLRRDEDRDYHEDFLPGRGGQPCSLVFMSRGDLFFNEAVVVIRCGLVEVLREMIRKGLILPTSTVYERVYEGTYPLLWKAYFESPDASCFELLLSQDNVECDVIHDDDYGHGGSTLLIEASKLCYFPLGAEAYRALVNHPTTNVNAQVRESSMYFGKGDTALHAVVSKMKYRCSDGDTAVMMARVLMEAGADPMLGSEENGTVVDYFNHLRNSPVNVNSWTRILDEHVDEIEAVITAKQRAKKPRTS